MSDLGNQALRRVAVLERKFETLSARLDKILEIATDAQKRQDAFEKQLNKSIKSDRGLTDKLYQTAFMVDDDLKSIFERLQNLEFAVFPRLRDAAVKLGKIIGNRPTLRSNPLDRKGS